VSLWETLDYTRFGREAGEAKGFRKLVERGSGDTPGGPERPRVSRPLGGFYFGSQKSGSEAFVSAFT
jgi:hypothetical protein